jgi:hypothetical protein
VGPLLELLLVACERAAHGIEKNLLGRGLLEEVFGAAAHRLHRRRGVRMARQEEDGKRASGLRERGLEVEAAEVRHAQVDDHAPRLVGTTVGKELARRGIRPRQEAAGAQEARHRHQKGLVIIDDVHGRLGHVPFSLNRSITLVDAVAPSFTVPGVGGEPSMISGRRVVLAQVATQSRPITAPCRSAAARARSPAPKDR